MPSTASPRPCASSVRHPDDPDLQLLPGDGHHDRGPRSAQRRCHSVHRYDNVRYKRQPEAWNMRLVIGMATVLGVLGPIAALACSASPRTYTTSIALSPDPDVPDAFCGRVVAPIFLTRTCGLFWSEPRPARDPFGGRAQRRSHRLHARPVRDLHAVPRAGTGCSSCGPMHWCGSS